MRVATTLCEIVFRSAQITGAFFACRRDELHRPARTQPSAVDLAGERQHHGQAATVVVDPRANETFTLPPDRRIGLAREHGVEMRADYDRLEIFGAFAATDRIARSVGVDLRQPAIAEATRDPTAALVLFTCRRGNLRDGDLSAHDRIVVRGEARVR